MPISPLAGKPAPRDYAHRRRRAGARIPRAQARSERSDATRRLRHQRASRHAAATARSPNRTSSPSRKPSATTAANSISTARSTWARTRTPFPARRSTPRSKCWPPTASKRSSSPTTASRRRPSSRGRSSSTTAAAREHLADGIVITPSHNPPEDGGFKYNPPNGGPADTDVTSWIQNRANDLLKSNNAEREADAAGRRAQSRDHAPARFCPPVCRRFAQRRRHGRDPLGRAQAGRRSARRGGGCTIGSRSSSCYGLDITVVNKVVDPHVLVHDGRSRRPDPHGLLEPLCDGSAGRIEGQISRRVRQRSGFRSARHRHARRRLDESEPFFGRRDSLSADASAALAGASGGRQNAGQQQHDRPRGAISLAASCRKCRSDSNGLPRACSTARIASAARRAPGRASCAATARSGPPTRTARSWTCWPPKSPPSPAKTPASIIKN